MTRCPKCRAPAYIGFTVIECPTRGCVHFSEKELAASIRPIPVPPQSPFGYSLAGWTPTAMDAQQIVHELTLCSQSFTQTKVDPQLLQQIEQALKLTFSNLQYNGLLPAVPSVQVLYAYAIVDVYFSKWFCDGMNAHGYTFLVIP